MPVLRKAPCEPPSPADSLAATDCADSDEVFVIRVTGEVFKDYDAYLERLGELRSPAFVCAATGKSGLTYEQCLVSEHEANSLLQQCKYVDRGLLVFKTIWAK